MTSPNLGLWDLEISVEFWLLQAHKVHKEESHQWTVLAKKYKICQRNLLAEAAMCA